MSDDRCTACEGNGWIDDAVAPDGTTFVRPCARCRPALYDRWRDGHLDPGHTCEECRTRRPLKSAPKPFTVENTEPEPIPEDAF
jgi:hypothetical protein